jgi:hypothetical protein
MGGADSGGVRLFARSGAPDGKSLASIRARFPASGGILLQDDLSYQMLRFVNRGVHSLAEF